MEISVVFSIKLKYSRGIEVYFYCDCEWEHDQTQNGIDVYGADSQVSSIHNDATLHVYAGKNSFQFRSGAHRWYWIGSASKTYAAYHLNCDVYVCFRMQMKYLLFLLLLYHPHSSPRSLVEGWEMLAMQKNPYFAENSRNVCVFIVSGSRFCCSQHSLQLQSRMYSLIIPSMFIWTPGPAWVNPEIEISLKLGKFLILHFQIVFCSVSNTIPKIAVRCGKLCLSSRTKVTMFNVQCACSILCAMYRGGRIVRVLVCVHSMLPSNYIPFTKQFETIQWTFLNQPGIR